MSSDNKPNHDRKRIESDNSSLGPIESAIDRIPDEAGQRTEPNCQARIDETGRYYLEDPTNEEAYLWTRHVEEVRC